MFIQVVRGRTDDAAGLRDAMEWWHRELRPQTQGFLGSTGGVADDGTAVVLARFSSEADARANSERAEQSAWWEETSALFGSDPTFYDCPEVALTLGGGSDDAGFVQLMIYTPSDVGAIRDLTAEFETVAPSRPDILGGTTAFATDGTVIETNYFTSADEARAAEGQEMTPEVAALMQKFRAAAGEVTFIDLNDPWLH